MTDSVTPTAELISVSRLSMRTSSGFSAASRGCRRRATGWRGSPAGPGGITLRPEWVINGNYHPSSGYEMFAALYARLGRPPKALFTAACGLLEGAAL